MPFITMTGARTPVILATRVSYLRRVTLSKTLTPEEPIMPKWSHNIPDDPRGPALPIRRAPAYGKLIAIVTSPDLLGCYTHYWRGRTMPCEAPDCEACRNGMPYRWHAYFAAEDLKTCLHFLFEVTALAAEPFVDYRSAHGTLRGCLFESCRWQNRPNGRILIRTKPADLKERRIARAPDLEKCLSILWHLPTAQFDTSRRNPETQIDTVHIDQPDPRFGT